MKTIDSSAELTAYLADIKAGGSTVAFVPTMGNLHAGHLSLVQQAKLRANIVVVSIFINPKQFGANEDLASYPRTLQEDLKQLDALQTDVVFTPNDKDIYPEGVQSHTVVTVPELTDVLCGASRPGHFDGVSTVVCKLLNVVKPDVALFGEKDLQQLLLIKKMVRDLAMGIEIVGIATARADDGLALSSRNGYLSADQRTKAPALYRELERIHEAITAGRRDFDTLCREAVQRLTKTGFKPDYVEVRRRSDLASAQAEDTEVAIFGAASLGSTRLIDNRQVDLSTASTR